MFSSAKLTYICNTNNNNNKSTKIMPTTIAKTSKKIVDVNLDDKIELLTNLWSIDFLDEDQINDISKIICQNMRLDGLNEHDQILPFGQYLDGDFLMEYDDENEDPHIYSTITSYLNCGSLTTSKTVRGIDLIDLSKNTPELTSHIYKLWFNWNGYYGK